MLGTVVYGEHTAEDRGDSVPALVRVCMLSLFSRVRLFETPWAIARQVPLSMGFSRQEYRSGLPCPPPGDLLNPGIESKSHTSPVLAGRFFTTSKWNLQMNEVGGRIEQIKLNKQPHVFYFVLRALALEGNQ